MRTFLLTLLFREVQAILQRVHTIAVVLACLTECKGNSPLVKTHVLDTGLRIQAESDLAASSLRTTFIVLECAMQAAKGEEKSVVLFSHDAYKLQQ